MRHCIYPVSLGFEHHGNRPKYFCWTNVNTRRCSFLLYGNLPHKGTMTPCHMGANPNLTPPRPRLQSLSSTGKRASFCPLTSLSSAHLPVKTFVPWLISVSAHPFPPHTPHPRVYFSFPTNPCTYDRNSREEGGPYRPDPPAWSGQSLCGRSFLRCPACQSGARCCRSGPSPVGDTHTHTNTPRLKQNLNTPQKKRCSETQVVPRSCSFDVMWLHFLSLFCCNGWQEADKQGRGCHK